jgi:glutathione S-transferase
MITLYRRPDSSAADAVQDALEEIVIAHTVCLVRGREALPDRVAEAATSGLPVLVDDGTVVSGRDALDRHLESLRQLMADWDRFGGDACYIDDDGTVCGAYDVDATAGPSMTSDDLTTL